MSNRSETFGRLLKGAINSIAAYEGKTAPAIEDELGDQIGVSGSTIQRYKAGYLPTEARVVQIMAEAAVRRGYLSRAWLMRFLQATRYPTPDTLMAQLAEALGSTAIPRDSALPSGTLAFLFTDVEGSTTLWEQQPQAMERALARHDEIMRQAIDAYGGHVFKTVGDAFYAVFATAADALDAVLAAQRALAAEAWGPIGSIRVRAALHVGAAQQRDGDYFGAPLNRAARLSAVGHGGQILLSLAAQELVRDTLPKGASLRDLGEHRLKDLARPERVFQVVASDLPSDFPALRSLDSYRHNLPPQPTALIGRESEIAAVCDQLRRDDTHLLTLTGPGGTGKTRLALQAAAELLDDFRDGVFFVPLAPIRDPQLVAAAIAQALGVKETGDQPLPELLKAYLRGKRALLLLDNFEQVAAAAPLVAELLTAAPELKAIVTSRETLHLYGEREYGVPPLSLPDIKRLPPIERLTQYEAVRLFIERAQAVRPDFAITTENAPAVAEICARLDGLPLAIELAAARSKLFSPRAMLSRLDRRLGLLTGGPRDLPHRQQTLRSAITWSYDLLDAAEQALFARLGVFVGGCTLEAAEAVLGDEGSSEAEIFIGADTVLNSLSSLVDKSLLKQVEGVGDEPRFVMLETLREYALERLAASGEEDAIRQRHGAFFLGLAEQAEPLIRFMRPDRDPWLERLTVEYDNLRATMAWFGELEEAELGLRLGGALRSFWVHHYHWGEGRALLEAALAQSGHVSIAVRAQALVSAGHLTFVLGDNTTARAYAEEAVALLRGLGDNTAIAIALLLLGSVITNMGEYALAHTIAEECLVLFDTENDLWGRAQVIWLLGSIASTQGNLTQAAAYIDEMLTIYRQSNTKKGIGIGLHLKGYLAQLQDDWEHAVMLCEESLVFLREVGAKEKTASVLQSLGFAALRQGDDRRAATCFVEGLTLCKELEDRTGIAYSIVGIASTAAARAYPERSARLLGAAEALVKDIGMVIDTIERAEYDRSYAIAREQLGEDAFAAAWAAGQSMTLDQAIAEALGA